MIEDLFKVAIYRTFLHDEIPDDLNKIFERLTSYYNNNQLKTPESWRTDMLTSHNVLDPNIEYSGIMKKINNHVYTYVKQMGYDINNVSCTEAWFNYGIEHSYQEYHVHANNHISGVYYIKTPENCGNIVFRSGVNMYPMPNAEKNTSIYGAKSSSITPQEDVLLLFPADLEHMVEVNKTKEPRISLSFNFKLN